MCFLKFRFDYNTGEEKNLEVIFLNPSLRYNGLLKLIVVSLCVIIYGLTVIKYILQRAQVNNI